MSWSKDFVRLSSALIAAVVVSGCSGGDSESTTNTVEETAQIAAVTVPDDPEPITLRVAIWDENQLPTQQKFIDAFESVNPNVTVEIEVLTFGEYVPTLQAAEAGGGGYDIIWMNAPNLPTFAGSEILLPLNDFVERDNFDTSVFPKGLVDMYTIDGNYYAVSKDFDTIGLYFDKAAFTEAGVDQPTNDWTWDDLSAAAAALTTADRKGFAAPSYEQEVLFPFIYLADGDPLTPDRSATDLESPAACSALEFIQSFHTDETTLDLASLESSWYVESLVAGDVAMVTSGSWDAKVLVDQMGDRVGLVELPAGVREANLVHGLGWAIMASSQHPDMAWEFIKSVSTREAHEMQARDGVVISSYEGTAEAWVDSFDTLDVSTLVDAAAIANPFPVAASDGGWTYATSSAFAEELRSGETGAAMCANVNKTANAYIADHPARLPDE